MILGNWQNIKLICGNHGEDYSHEMIIHQGREGMSTFYSCPCYQSLLQKEITNKSCNNRLNIVDYEKMLDTVSDEMLDDDGNITNIRGFAWKRKGIDFKVLDDDNGILTICMLNRKAIAK